MNHALQAQFHPHCSLRPGWDNTFHRFIPCHSAIRGLPCQFHTSYHQRLQSIRAKEMIMSNINLSPVLFHRKTNDNCGQQKEGGSRIFSHPKLKTWSLSLPRACPLATFCFAAFFAGALIKHDLCPSLPLARIYCITSKKNIKKNGKDINPCFGNAASLHIQQSSTSYKQTDNAQSE